MAIKNWAIRPSIAIPAESSIKGRIAMPSCTESAHKAIAAQG